MKDLQSTIKQVLRESMGNQRGVKRVAKRVVEENDEDALDAQDAFEYTQGNGYSSDVLIDGVLYSDSDNDYVYVFNVDGKYAVSGVDEDILDNLEEMDDPVNEIKHMLIDNHRGHAWFKTSEGSKKLGSFANDVYEFLGNLG